MYYVYLLRCADGTLYTGFTNDLARRLAAHNAGKARPFGLAIPRPSLKVRACNKLFSVISRLVLAK